MNLDGSELKEIVGTGMNFAPKFWQDEKIIFARKNRKNSELYLIDKTGNGLEKVRVFDDESKNLLDSV